MIFIYKLYQMQYNKIMEKNNLIKIEIQKSSRDTYPYNLPLFSKNQEIKFQQPITFIVGENGAGKSTFLESLADVVGFNVLGGNANHNYFTDNEQYLSDVIKLTWRIRSKKGFFFRAESFFNFSDYIDKMIDEDNSIKYSYGGKKLNKQSHGESFLSLFKNRFKDGLFILDEPEAALSPEKQLALVSILNELVNNNDSQFIIATHSPILIATPNSEVFEIEDNEFVKKKYTETKQFKLYKSFINDSERYIHYLLK